MGIFHWAAVGGTSLLHGDLATGNRLQNCFRLGDGLTTGPSTPLDIFKCWEIWSRLDLEVSNIRFFSALFGHGRKTKIFPRIDMFLYFC